VAATTMTAGAPLVAAPTSANKARGSRSSRRLGVLPSGRGSRGGSGAGPSPVPPPTGRRGRTGVRVRAAFGFGGKLDVPAAAATVKQTELELSRGIWSAVEAATASFSSFQASCLGRRGGSTRRASRTCQGAPHRHDDRRARRAAT
jgi:hypothetical protein